MGYHALETDDGQMYIHWENGATEFYPNTDHTDPAPVPEGLPERLDALKDCVGGSCKVAEGP